MAKQQKKKQKPTIAPVVVDSDEKMNGHQQRLWRRTAERLDGRREDAALRKLQARARKRHYKSLSRKEQAAILSPTAAGDRQFSDPNSKHFQHYAPARLRGAS